MGDNPAAVQRFLHVVSLQGVMRVNVRFHLAPTLSEMVLTGWGDGGNEWSAEPAGDELEQWEILLFAYVFSIAVVSAGVN